MTDAFTLKATECHRLPHGTLFVGRAPCDMPNKDRFIGQTFMVEGWEGYRFKIMGFDAVTTFGGPKEGDPIAVLAKVSESPCPASVT